MLSKNGRTITKKTVLCEDVFSQGLGLMFRGKNAVKDIAWVFSFKNPRRIGLTMAFMSFPIDVVFLDEKYRIVDLKKNLLPWSFYKSKVKCCHAIELENGSINKKSLKKGDELKF